MKNKTVKGQSGASLVAVIIITGIIVAGGFAVYKFLMPEIDDEILVEEEMMGEEEIMMDKEDEMMEEEDSMMGENDKMKVKYGGMVLAGSSALLLDFNKTDYDVAFKTDKLIVLYFYANWCPICRAEFPKMQEAFNDLTTDQVIGFRVNYNDNETDSDEQALAREYGVAYQHTKVFIRNGERIGKWPDGWDTERYLNEINSRL